MTLLVAAIILALYFWAYFSVSGSISDALLVSDISAILAGITAIISFIAYLWVPKTRLYTTSYFVYLSVAITTAFLVVETGGTSSPFIALWMLVAVFAGIFGAKGLLPLVVAVNVYLVTLFMSAGGLGRDAIIAIILAGELPLLASFIIWHHKSSKESGKDRAYRDLANELSQVANKSEVVINAIGDGVIAIDNQGIIQLINPAAQQMLGWGKQDALALSYKSVLQLSTSDNKELVDANDPIQLVLANNKKLDDEFTLTTKTGKKRLVSIVTSPVGQVGSGVILVFRDITKEKIEEREQAEFISTASHEMRTPVASIEGYLGLALNPATAQIDDKARDYINKAHESAQHLGRLFQDLLDVTKAEDGRLSNNPKVVDVVVFAHDIVQGLLPKAQEKGLRVLYKPMPDNNSDQHEGSDRRLSPVFYADLDNDHLREVIANLVENAIKYTLHGDVVIDVSGDNEHVVISVSDSGIGIPAEDMPHLFQKFYRVDNSDTREIGGTGLGLYLCRRLAEAMNGRIWAESEYKKGSTFYVELPRISHEEAMIKIEQATEAEKRRQEEETATPLESPVQAPTAAPSPVPQNIPPVAPAQPTPAPRQPEPAQIMTPPPTAGPQPTTPPQRQNTPLSAIEQTPSDFIQQRTQVAPPRPQNMNIPQRGQDQQQ